MERPEEGSWLPLLFFRRAASDPPGIPERPGSLRLPL
jgi:hypothetical protein